MIPVDSPADRAARLRIANFTLAYMLRHPQLAPLREAGMSIEVSHDAASIRTRARHGSGDQLEVAIRHAGWWVPVLDTEEDWAWELAGRLAKRLRRGWEAGRR